MKKSFKSIIAIAAVGLLGLTGCDSAVKPNGGGGNAGEGIGEIDKSVKTKIVFYHNSSEDTVLQTFIDELVKANPYIEVTNLKSSTSYAGIKSQTISDFGTGEFGDLVLCYPDHVADYMTYNKVVKLDDYMTDSKYGFTKKERDDLLDVFLKEGQSFQTEGTYCLPFAKSTEAMFYNRDKVIGLNLASVDPTINNGQPLTASYIENLTWDELFDKLLPAIDTYNKALPEGSKLVVGKEEHSTLFTYDSDDNLFITLCEQYGTGYTKLDEYGEASLLWNNAEIKQVIKKFANAYKKGYIQTQGTHGTYTDDLFTANESLFCVGSTGGVKYQQSDDFVTGVAKIPQKKVGDNIMISQGPSLCILDHGDANRRIAAWMLYKQIYNLVNNVTWATQTGYMPVRESAYVHEGYLSYLTENTKQEETDLNRLKARTGQFVNDHKDDLFTNPAFVGSSASRDQVGGLFTSCLLDEDLDKNIDSLFKSAYDAAMMEIK